ncbi:MAG: PP2C family protein-serine/threonine phosphatase [Ignavibacteriota bacterium]
MRPLFVPLMVALAGVVSLALLFPRFDPSAHAGDVLTREQAIAKTRQIAAANGLKTDGWKAVAVESLETPTGPLKIQTALIAPHSARSFEAAWFPDGRLAWSRLPDQTPTYQLGRLQANGRAESGQTGKVAVRWDPKSAKNNLRYLALDILNTLWRIGVVVYLLVAMVRRRLRYRVGLILAIFLAVWAAASFWGGTGYQKVDIVKASVTKMIANESGDFDVNVGGSASSNEQSRGTAIFWMLVLGVVGFSVRGVANHRKWHTVELLTRRRFFGRSTGWSVAAGLLSGIGIAAIPYWIAASGAFAGSVLVFRSVEPLVSPIPVSVAWDLSASVLAVGIFGFWCPLVSKLRQSLLRWISIATVGIVAIGNVVTPFSTPGANLFTAVVLFGAFWLVYLKTDVLATMLAMVAARAVLAPCVILAQPGGSVRAIAVPLLLTWAVALAASVHLSIRGREGDELPVSPTIPDTVEEPNTKSGRMRLEAEFDVARKAQEDALPASAPEVEGYTIAGSCEPAQQVGGDLYDYFSLADGRLGIAVADVSGKGVPAALYMMVTKGLLAATTRDSSDLAYILQQVNRHLYTTCKKKVFVTLAAVALDPEARRLQHARAGHNPVVWRRAARGETQVLKPPGVGLGMATGERFNRVLKVDELQLEEGDAIVLYSDGITEAMNAALEQFGEGRLLRAVESTDGQPAEESRAAILRELAAFTNGTPARDDVTLVVLRVAQTGVLT